MSLNRRVFKWNLKVRMFSHSRISAGRDFQVDGAATEKARQASSVCMRGTTSIGASEERRARGGARVCTSSLRYVGVAVVCSAWPCTYNNHHYYNDNAFERHINNRCCYSVTLLERMSILCLRYAYILDYRPTGRITPTTTTTSLNVRSTTGAARRFPTSTPTSLSSGSITCSCDSHPPGFLQYCCQTCRYGLILNIQPPFVYFIKATIVFFIHLTL